MRRMVKAILTHNPTGDSEDIDLLAEELLVQFLPDKGGGNDPPSEPSDGDSSS